MDDTKLTQTIRITHNDAMTTSGQIAGERGGTAFPFRFWQGTQFP